MERSSYLCISSLLVFGLWSRYVTSQITDYQVPFPAVECNNNGYRNPHDPHSCVCLNGWTGYDCSRRQCPTGRAWVDYATAQDTAHAIDVECSNRGYCDHDTGECECMTGFWGPACERMECPDECSGHGDCISMAEAAERWDGRNLVVPYATYSNWDADMIYGCLCHEGYTGYDCSLKECPKGDDPLTANQRNERMVIECTATNGSFVFSYGGYTTKPIHFNQTYGVVAERLLELPSIKGVHVHMDGPSVCNTSGARTEVTFTQNFGSLPPARVTTLDLRDGGSKYDSSVKMVTESFLSCDVCTGCAGGFYLGFLDVWTDLIEWNATLPELEAGLRDLATFSGPNAVYGPVTVNVTSTLTASGWTTDNVIRVCDPSYYTITRIEMRGEFGNLPDLTLINSVYDSYTNNPKQFNLTTSKGTKENVYCSNHGVCDFDTGTCLCFQSRYNYFYWESSDGYGHLGTRGDCGHTRVSPSACPYSCSDHGVCTGNFTCSCYEPYWGPDCAFIKCPRGRAWFDEPTGVNHAHAPGAICSNRGICDDLTGTCLCQQGFTGQACEELECPTTTGSPCSGHGRCMSIRRMAELGAVTGDLNGFSYGSRDLNYWNADATWDSEMVHGCHCDIHDDLQPYAGPVDVFSGVTVNNPLLTGYTGYDCSRRWCPRGDDVITPGSFEVQTLICTRSRGSFTLSFRQKTTAPIPYNASTTDIQAALEALTTIGTVKVNFTNSYIACSSHGNHVRITFTSELGDVPLLRASHNMTVLESAKGTKENVECSNRGYCDYGSGECACLEGFGSSDGAGNVGTRGDCGALNVHPPYMEVTSSGGVSATTT